MLSGSSRVNPLLRVSRSKLKLTNQSRVYQNALMTRSIHNIAKPAVSAIGDEKSVLVYDSKEYERKLTHKKLIPTMCRAEGGNGKWRLRRKYGEI